MPFCVCFRNQCNPTYGLPPFADISCPLLHFVKRNRTTRLKNTVLFFMLSKQYLKISCSCICTNLILNCSYRSVILRCCSASLMGSSVCAEAKMLKSTKVAALQLSLSPVPAFIWRWILGSSLEYMRPIAGSMRDLLLPLSI